MSRKFLTGVLTAAVLALPLTSANAADLIPNPPIISDPAPHAPKMRGSAKGWYLRGDVGGTLWHEPVLKFNNGEFINNKISKTLVGGVGIGYQAHKYFRADATFDLRTTGRYMGDSPCPGGCGGGFSYHDEWVDLSVYTLMANAYVDVGTFGGITPYVGAGAGVAHVGWSNYRSVNKATAAVNGNYPGGESLRFTYALHAGASYDISSRLSLDASYRYQHISNGKVTQVLAAGDVEHEALKAHDFRLGLRYKLGGGGSAHHSYEQPAGAPIYYK